ncbi:gamma-tubulin complex component 5-like [Hydractinia symbiolongicarpus]|uniref:gamma-tubulin complex component 5-like n=1 Tax=Hydractinia symbiolongicarpus TaxID=13093 RepID=UPI00254DBE7D|nr:gamma-tubulin complex component 5-like [Hydractinia symbiolongicarpus]
MAPISLKKGLIDVLAGELIRHIFDVDKRDENFKIALEYVMSNFRFHRFLDVNPLDVSRSIAGLCSKFRVNSQDKKATHLEELVDLFVNQPLLETNKEEKETQTDAHYSLLDFLLSLSNNPLNSKFVAPEEKRKQNATDTFDWKTYLLEGEEELSIGAAINEDVEKELYNSDEELWAFSEEEVIEEIEEDEHMYAEIVELQKKYKREKICDVSKELAWLNEHVVPSYWVKNESSEFKITKYRYSVSNSRMCENWEIFKREEAENRQGPGYQQLIEKQLVKETLWMLQGVESLYVYVFKDGCYTVNENIVVSHLTKESLSSYLHTFTSIGNKVVELKKFSFNVTQNENEMSKTFRAFGYVLGRYLSERKAEMAKLEQSLIEQDEIITLVVLKDKLLEDSAKVNCVYQLYTDAVLKGHVLYSTVTERVVYFLDIFFDMLCAYDSLGDAGLDKVLIILPMFLDVCQPYLYDLEQWMIMGRLPNSSDEEFMIYRAQVIEQGEANYWENTYRIKETIDKVALLPKFIKDVQKQVLLAGKSLGLLEEFGKFATSVLSIKSLHVEFKDNLKKILQESNNRFLKGKDFTVTEDVVDFGNVLIEDPTMDPLIRENFNMMFLNNYRKLKKQNDIIKNDSQSEYAAWLQLLKDGSCRPPIKLLIEQSLFPAIFNRYDKACAVLLELFKKEWDLFKHLEVMENFFLMEAGGTMHTFYSEIFQKGKRKEFWQDMPYLNIVMQDSLQINYPHLMGSLTVTIETPDYNNNANLFDCISLHYKAPWPVTIILDNETEQKYNQIFKFLMKIKRAIWALEQLRFHDLTSSVPLNESSDLNSSSDEDEPIRRAKKNDQLLSANQQKLKNRMLILRMKMMHVIRNFHFYLMTRIQNATCAEFKSKVIEAKDLDEIMELHRKFLHNLKQRCFLHEKIGRSREAIFRVLSLVFDFELLWLSSVHRIDMSRINTIEKDFNRCTSFLHSFFSSLAKRGSYPHFEFLAQSLKTESQGHQALFRR